MGRRLRLVTTGTPLPLAAAYVLWTHRLTGQRVITRTPPELRVRHLEALFATRPGVDWTITRVITINYPPHLTRDLAPPLGLAVTGALWCSGGQTPHWVRELLLRAEWPAAMKAGCA